MSALVVSHIPLPLFPLTRFPLSLSLSLFLSCASLQTPSPINLSLTFSPPPPSPGTPTVNQGNMEQIPLSHMQHVRRNTCANCIMNMLASSYTKDSQPVKEINNGKQNHTNTGRRPHNNKCLEHKLSFSSLKSEHMNFFNRSIPPPQETTQSAWERELSFTGQR